MFCKQCGNEISDLYLKKCPKCNTAIGKGGRFCPDCGKKLRQGEKCDCSSDKQNEISKTEASLNKKSNTSAVENTEPNTKPQKNEEPNPTVSRRIAGNPLLEKIARGDNITDKSKEILQEEAVKMVYGKDMTVEKLEELERQKQTAEDGKNKTETKEPEAVPNSSGSINKSEEVPVPKSTDFERKEERCDNRVSKLPEKCEKEDNKPLKRCNEQKSEISTGAENAPVQNNRDQEIKKQTQPDLPQPAPILNQNNIDSKNLFPEAFAPANMQYNLQNQAPVMHGPVSKPSYSQFTEKKKKFDGMWVTGLICSVLSLSGVKFIPFLVFFILSLLFGIIDILLNEKKTGIGVLIGEAIIGIYFFISVLGGVL